MSTKPGFTVASRRPRRKRFVAMLAKDLHAGVVMRMIPQPVGCVSLRILGDVNIYIYICMYSKRENHKPNVATPKNFAIGNRCNAYPAGYCATKYPK